MTTKYMNKESDMVLYKGEGGEIKSLGYTINSVLPYLNIPAMKGGGNIPGKKSNSNKLVIPAGLAYLVNPFSIAKLAAQRVPLPHCSASEPSALYMRKKKSESGEPGGSTTSN